MQRNAISIIKTLRKNGFEAYLAGGCVRDILLGLEPKDYDIATSAKPEDIERIFKKTYAIGRAFGVMHVHEGKYHYEVATFREDRGYEDKRRPNKVFFKSPKEDALRRDFTINAMFMDPLKKNIDKNVNSFFKVIDFTGGLVDLKEKLVKFVGNPETRLEEDSLRLLRAVRFVHQIEGQYHPDTYNALKKYSHEIKHISFERIADELNKILSLKTRAKALEDLYEIGILENIFPELCDLKGVAQPSIYHKEGDVWTHTMKALSSIKGKPKLEFFWTVLLHDIAKPKTYKFDGERIRFDHHAEIGSDLAKNILKRFKFSNKFIEKVSWLVGHHMMLHDILEMPKARQIHWLTHPWFKDLLNLEKADSMGTKPTRLDMYKKIKKLYLKIKKETPKKPKPLFSGDDIIKITGISQGKKIGKLKEELYDLQLESKIKTKNEGKKYLKTLTK